MLVSIDTLNQGIHFTEHYSAYDIAYKALAVNLSDIAAMGGQPCWFTLALSLPAVDEAWLREFSQGLAALATQHHVALVGGDTTKGPLSITIQIAGTAPPGKSLCRHGAKLEDDIYVTGYLGDAAAGLLASQTNLSFTSEQKAYFLQRLQQPTPRVELGMALRDIANACIDVSDGLAADLSHMLDKSRVGAQLDISALPCSPALQSAALSQKTDLALYGGDDYELCFTADQQARSSIAQLSQDLGCPITCIGSVIATSGLFSSQAGKQEPLPVKGFDHFAHE